MQDFCSRTLKAVGAQVEHHPLVGDFETFPGILLDQDDGQSLVAQQLDGPEDLLDHLGSKPKGWLVQHDQLGFQDHAPGDGR